MAKKEDIATNVENAVKATAKKATRTAKKAAEKAEPAVKAASKAVKSAAVKQEVFVQWGGKEIKCKDLVAAAKKDYKASHKDAVRTCQVYVKPEDGAAYYVINDVTGKIEL